MSPGSAINTVGVAGRGAKLPGWLPPLSSPLTVSVSCVAELHEGLLGGWHSVQPGVETVAALLRDCEVWLPNNTQPLGGPLHWGNGFEENTAETFELLWKAALFFIRNLPSSTANSTELPAKSQLDLSSFSPFPCLPLCGQADRQLAQGKGGEGHYTHAQTGRSTSLPAMALCPPCPRLPRASVVVFSSTVSSPCSQDPDHLPLSQPLLIPSPCSWPPSTITQPRQASWHSSAPESDSLLPPRNKLHHFNQKRLPWGLLW